MTKEESTFYTSPTDSEGWMPIFNDKVAVRLPGEATNGEYSIIEVHAIPGGGVPPHIHEKEDEIFIVKKGIATLEFDGKTLEAKEGSVTVLPRNKPHAFFNKTAETLELLIMMRPAGFEQFFAENVELKGDMEKMGQLLKTKYGITMLVG